MEEKTKIYNVHRYLGKELLKQGEGKEGKEWKLYK